MNKDVLLRTLSDLWQKCNASYFKGELKHEPIFKIFESELLAGYFEPGKKKDEIWLNARYFRDLPLADLIDTIVHEMAHQFQKQTGRPYSHDDIFEELELSLASYCF